METWRPILGFEGWYEASDEGRVRAIQRPARGGGRCFNEPYPLVLTPLVYRKGYLKYRLGTCNGIREPCRLFVHRIVYEAFHGAIPSGLTVNHIDANKTNNRLSNLETATSLEQVHHARKLGLLRWRSAKGNVKARLKNEDVVNIRAAYAAGVSPTKLARRYRVVKGTIGHIVARRSWKHLP